MGGLQRLITLVVGLTALTVTVTAAHALKVPALKGRINDYADMLSESTERQLDNLLRDVERTDSTQIVVLTIPSLEGENLEEFSIRVAESWKIGQKGLDNGAILLVARNDRKIRIEVGYGLEGKLTDLMAGRIIRNVIVPRFKAGDFNQGISDGIQTMVEVVRGQYSAADERRRELPRGAGGGGQYFGIFVFIFIISILSRIRRGIGMVAGGLLAPMFGAMFWGLGLLWLLLLIPVGILTGLILSVWGPPLSFGHGTGSHTRGGWYSGGGGFSSGGFGGFSGGGGGFGGGGASGSW